LPEIERLAEELHKAIESQEFERAAVLRDRIRELKQKEASA
jgi:protein-arginine kinase activator protein McsA